MKNIAQILNTREVDNVKRPMGADQLTLPEREAVGYFFVRLKMLDPMQFDNLMPDDKTERLIKREYAPYLRHLTRDKIDAGFAVIHDLRQQGDPEHKFLNIDKIIGVICDRTTGRAGIYKVFEPLGLPDKTAEERARKAARPHLDELKGMFE